MPRSSNNKSSQTKQNIPAPAPTPSASPLPSASTTHVPSMVDSMKQGFGFGIGSAIARNLFNTNNKDENTKKSEITNEPKLTNDKIYELYNKCMEKNDKNIDCTIILQNNK
jgi:hypothetical protein